MPNIPYKDALNNTRYLKNSAAGTDLDPDTSPLEALVDALEPQVGIVTETAPASDTASSGLNGRLQRIAQRITSLIALLPASLGQKAKAASLSVTLASDQDAITANLGTIAGVALASSQTTGNVSLSNIDTRLGANGVASSKTGSESAQLRAIADLLDGTTDKTTTVTFTIANGANLSDTIDIGAGKTLLALITPSAFTAADLLFNTHPTASGSVCQKLTTAGVRYRLTSVPAAAAANYRVPNTDFMGDRYIQLASVTVGAATVVNQGASRTIVGLVGVVA